MINVALLNPAHIAIVGASNNLQKPGGGLVKNLMQGGYKGAIYPVNPKESNIQGLKAYNQLTNLPDVDMAILAIPAEGCVESIEFLASAKKTKAFIIISAGFSEMGKQGIALENQLKSLAEKYQLSIIGPNCIGVTNLNYKAIFVSPPPEIVPQGVDFVSASGALAVFLFETAAMHGLNFSNVFTVGNSATIGVEEILEHWDLEFDPKQSSHVKLVYVEQIRKPELFFKHIHSLRKKGCAVIVAKPGESEAGARAALSHTGALAGDSDALNMLIEKAGAIRCFGREEIVHIACILQQKKLNGKQLAVITHAGGPAVMMVDCLQKHGFKIPEIDLETRSELLNTLHKGSSATNPIDMLATANRDQLTFSIEKCTQLDYIDGIVVIYGKTGMEDLDKTYSSLASTIKKTEKPVYTIMPSVNAGMQEIRNYLTHQLPTFFDEVTFANALGVVYNHSGPFENALFIPPGIPSNSSAKLKALNEEETLERLKWCGLSYVQTEFIHSSDDLALCDNINFPVVSKVLGILHKTEVNGVILNIQNKEALVDAYTCLSNIPGAKGMLVQEMISGTELYLGAKMHEGIGYSVHAGIGGVFIELMRDVQARLAPITPDEAAHMLTKLNAQKIFTGFRNMPQVDEAAFARLISNFSNIFKHYPDIREIDLNPLIANGDEIIAVDARIII